MRRRRGSGRSDDGGDRAGGKLRLAGISLGVTLVGFAVGWLVATQMLFPAPAAPGDLVEVPNVTGLDLERAGELLDEIGLSLGTVGGFRHPTVDSGVVVGQAPLAGQLATPHSPVRITLSRGPERRPVPEVRRLRADRARNVLEATGFSVSEDSVESDVPTGRVLEVEPEEGTELVLPGEVRLVVSVGPPTFEMPRVLGMREGEARDTLRALGLVVGEVAEVFRFGRDQGVVVEQSPAENAVVQRGTAVRLSVGRRGGGGNNDPSGP